MNITTSIKPDSILANCTLLHPSDDTYLNHPIIGRFGSPSQPIYVDQYNVDINGVTYEQPLILPIVNGQLELVQCAVLQNEQRIQVIPDGLAKGFACYGDMQKDKPIIITHNLEAFFKLASSIALGFEPTLQPFAVVLVILPKLCNAHQTALKPFDFEQIQFVIQQLSKAGFTQLYMPVRAEHIQLEAFKKLEQNPSFRLINQTVQYDEGLFHIDLS